jgi:hypothetical protein
MADNGLTPSSLQGAVLAKLLDSLGISKYLTEDGCNHDEYPYKDSVDGWTKGNVGLFKTTCKISTNIISFMRLSKYE